VPVFETIMHVGHVRMPKHTKLVQFSDGTEVGCRLT